MRHLKWIPAFLLILGVALVVRWFGLNYAGYCHSEGRYLSEQEQIEIAIRDVLASYPPVIDLYEISDGQTNPIGRSKPANPMPYADAVDFQRNNERCCEATETGPELYTIPWSDRVSGDISTLIHLKYLVRYDDRYGNHFSEPVETHVAISNCGRPGNAF
jgi:hypothetical protein